MEYHRDNLNQVKLKLIRYLNLRIGYIKIIILR